ncbi:E3 ubiquitin-protein ligase SIRP1 isoform X2 [Brassica rapa]|uniref:RING-type E3 ubiquitin transferase n=1 Tax=Brassica campestris TaxID=3711 RepID=M4FA85_BRACM|nr:E3 ubiquitin-protein ligase SIRP1 isoform X2 [Brassica rapa]
MEEETTAYWCHTCSQTVTSLTTEEAGIKCPFCQSGFLEEMQQREDTNVHRPMDSILTPIFMEMMNNSARIHPGADMDSQLQEILRRRGRRPVSIDQLLQGIYAGLTLAPAAAAADDNNRERGRVIVTNPYNQIVAVPSSAVSNTLPPVAGSLSEYFIGPEFEAMLESLTETDPRRYGTPPARRDAFEALASVEIKEAEAGLECCVCLDDFEMGTVGKQMPCKHIFHSDCLLPWLQLHSSCPVCRYQLPTAEDETNGGGGRSSSTSSSSQGSESTRDDDGDRSMLDDPMEA